MGAARTTPAVFEYIHSHQGQKVFVTDIAKATKLTAKQVQSAMYSLHTRDGHNIEVVLRGQCWIYRVEPLEVEEPEVVKSTTFEYLAMTKSGDILLQDSNGVVYRAREVE